VREGRKRLRLWCKRQAGTLAVALGVSVVILAVVVGVQAAMLYARGWRIAWGTVPEGAAAFGSVAAFGALWVAAQEWRSGQRERRAVDQERRDLAAAREAERRDHVMSQARLIIVEPVALAPQPFGSEARPIDRYMIIRNHSSEPVFNLHIDHRSPKDRDTYFDQFVPQRTAASTTGPRLIP